MKGQGITVSPPRWGRCKHCGHKIMESLISASGWRHDSNYFVWCQGKFGQDTAEPRKENDEG